MRSAILAYRGIGRVSRAYYKTLRTLMEKTFGACSTIYIDDVMISLEPNKSVAIHGRQDSDLTDYDVILPRIGPSYAVFGSFVLQSLRQRVYFPNTPEAYLISNDTMRNLTVLSDNGLPIPETYLACSPSSAKKICADMPGKIILKIPGRGMGRGVIFADSKAAAYSIIDALDLHTGSELVLQEYIPNPGEDIRLFVVGDEVVACMKRIAQTDEVRSNIHTGGHGLKYKSTEEMNGMALKASRIVGADICGVDLIEGKDGSLFVLETNMNPGFRISDVSGVNVMEKIVQYLEQTMPQSLHMKRERTPIEPVR